MGSDDRTQGKEKTGERTSPVTNELCTGSNALTKEKGVHFEMHTLDKR
jgi:hypothetical protein